MNSHIVIPVLISFAISLILGPVVIPFLRKLKMGQTERVEGVQSHLKKAGDAYHGRRDHPCIRCGHISDLCKRLPADHSGSVPYRWVRTDRFSGMTI